MASNDNTGAIWGNKDKKTDKHPDFTGSATINGVDYWVSAWKRGKDAKEKSPALQFQFRLKEEKQVKQTKEEPKPNAFDDTDIPF